MHVAAQWRGDVNREVERKARANAL